MAKYEKTLFGDEILEIDKYENKDKLGELLFSLLDKIRLEDFCNIIINDFEAIIDYFCLLSGEDRGQKISLLFNPHRLNTKSKSSKLSIFQSIKRKDFCNGLARAILFKKDRVKDLLYQTLQLGINGVQYINEFPPHVARNILIQYGMNDKKLILDPCGGWGGRMLGASVVSNRYDCYEPSTLTFIGLENLRDWIRKYNNKFDAKIFNKPFEDCDLNEKYYDFAITSPPYYDTEEYSYENTNSFIRYKNFEDWVIKFYIILIEKTMMSLKDEGVFIINIGNRVYPLDEILIKNFGDKYIIKEKLNYLCRPSGLRDQGKGELFFEIRKKM